MTNVNNHVLLYLCRNDGYHKATSRIILVCDIIAHLINLISFILLCICSYHVMPQTMNTRIITETQLNSNDEESPYFTTRDEVSEM